MKKSCLFLALILTLFLSGCSLLPGGPPGEDEEDKTQQPINMPTGPSFEDIYNLELESGDEIRCK